MSFRVPIFFIGTKESLKQSNLLVSLRLRGYKMKTEFNTVIQNNQKYANMSCFKQVCHMGAGMCHYGTIPILTNICA